MRGFDGLWDPGSRGSPKSGTSSGRGSGFPLKRILGMLRVRERNRAREWDSSGGVSMCERIISEMAFQSLVLKNDMIDYQSQMSEN